MEARPENFVPNSERYYVRSNKKRGEFHRTKGPNTEFKTF